jgi:hypothetical protein
MLSGGSTTISKVTGELEPKWAHVSRYRLSRIAAAAEMVAHLDRELERSGADIYFSKAHEILENALRMKDRDEPQRDL